MGSLDMSAAKRQFLELVEAVSSSQLPGFTIWLDSKLAEYKVNGSILPDDEEARNQQYPEWISRSLRQNLSFIFQGDNNLDSNNKSRFEDKITPRKAKRKLGLTETEASAISPKVPRSEDRPATVVARPESDLPFRLETEIVDEATTSPVVTVKQELTSGDEEGGSLHMTSGSQDVSRPMAAETPLPLLQQSFSLSTSRITKPPDSHFTDTKNISSSPVFPGRESHVGSMIAFSDNKVDHSQRFQPDGTMAIASAHSSAVHSETSSSVTSEAGPHVAGFSSLSHLTSASSLDNESATRLKKRDFTAQLSSWGRENEAESIRRTNFLCVLCNKSFTTNKTLKRHVKTHSEEKPFNCPYCDKTFGRADSCYRHQQSVHPDFPVVKGLREDTAS